jgi:AcrR family transcriptional regulator
MRVTKEQAAETRKALIDAGLNVFSEKGFAATRLEDIVQVAGLTRGAFYWHFKNKLELYCEVYKEGMMYLNSRLQRAIDTSKPALENIKMSLKFIASDISGDEYVGKMSKLQYTIEWTPDVRDKIELMEHETILPFRTLFYDLIEQGKASGHIKKHLDTDVIFKSMLSLLIGISTLRHEKNIPLEADNIEPMISIFIEGIKS